MAKRLPRLDPAQLQSFEQRLASSGISATQQRTIMASMRVAANPQAETPEYGIASLPPDRRKIADASVRETASVFSFTNNFEVPFDIQMDFNEEMSQAQAEDKTLEYAFIIGLLAYFLFPRSEVKTLEESILSAYVSAWQLAVKESAAKYGCPNARVGYPSGVSLKQMKEWAKRDAESIANTYDDNAQSALRKLYDANPLGNVAYYLGGMANWAVGRQQQKNLTIGINNSQKGWGLGCQDFFANNPIKTGFRLVGSPPVCPICSRIMGMGVVDYSTAASYGFASLHPNCPHWFEPTKIYRFDCVDLWVGS